MTKSASLRLVVVALGLGVLSTSAFAATDTYISNTVMRMQEQNATIAYGPATFRAAPVVSGYAGGHVASTREVGNREDQFAN